MAVSSLILLPMMVATSSTATLTTSMTTMVAFLVTASTATNYCSITPKHTMCQYQVAISTLLLTFSLFRVLAKLVGASHSGEGLVMSYSPYSISLFIRSFVLT